jgi:hypothetical protein
VVATGFDESYYASRDTKAAKLIRQAQHESPTENKIDDASMKDLDMELKDGSTPAEDFHNDETPNIWALPDEENSAAPETSEEELEKPSFLRRLRGRKGTTVTEEPEAKPETETPAEEEDEPTYPFGNPDDYSNETDKPAADEPENTDDTPADSDKKDESHHKDSDK